jgi:predicted acyltransferase
MTGERTEGLDIFRGLAIAAMIIVNNQGDWSRVYGPLRHAGWHGFTPADMIFPGFLFIAGLSLYLSARASLEGGMKPAGVLSAVLKRSFIIVLLGLSLNIPLDLDFASMRFPGVLQRIGLCLALAAVPVIWFSHKALLWTAIAISAVYWGIMYLFGPVDGGSDPLTLEGSFASYIDAAVFGAHRLKMGGVPGFEPEGLLSTMGAVSTTLLGAAFGPIIRADGRWTGKLTIISISGIIMIILGIGLSLEGIIPVNKNLWSPGYVVLTAGYACILLSIFCFFADHKGHGWFFYPLSSMGLAPLIIYYLSSLTGRITAGVKFGSGPDGGFVTMKQILFSNTAAEIPGPAGSLVYALMFLLLWIAAAVAIRKWRERRGIV